MVFRGRVGGGSVGEEDWVARGNFEGVGVERDGEWVVLLCHCCVTLRF